MQLERLLAPLLLSTILAFVLLLTFLLRMPARRYTFENKTRLSGESYFAAYCLSLVQPFVIEDTVKFVENQYDFKSSLM